MPVATETPILQRIERPPPPRTANWPITALALGAFATIAATAMPATALPMLSRDLDASDAESVWIIALFQIGSAITLLPAATLVEIRGVRPVLLAGLALFTVASFACITCTTLTGLAIARTFQGIGSAGVMTVTGALVQHYYPPDQYGRGTGIAAFASATAGAAGPAMGAFLAAWATWQAIFAISAANGLIALIIAWPALDQTGRASRPFPLGQSVATSVMTGAVMVGLFGMTQAHAHPIHAILLAWGLAGAVPLVRGQRKTANPVLPVDLLATPGLARAYGLSVGFFCAHMMTFLLLPFLLIYRLQMPAAQIGLLIIPLSLLAAVNAPLAARMAERHTASRVASAGIALLALGIFMLVLMPADAGWIGLAWRTAIIGTGFGLFQTPNFKLIIAMAPAHRSASASGLQATTRLIGQAIGSAIVALCLHAAGPMSLAPLMLAGLIALAVTVAGMVIPARDHAADSGPEEAEILP